ncbi:uncharacterized protein LOC120230923 [Hyaena hyaena]|uniref:uncharacterized protein LOC120230923 n=1 Tax=Hyaena hyaena TaxID=95912 RepID=UPI0019236441|nr:uncharacterized protein LOC120230923 [Hyaena hyaena]
MSRVWVAREGLLPDCSRHKLGLCSFQGLLGKLPLLAALPLGPRPRTSEQILCCFAGLGEECRLPVCGVPAGRLLPQDAGSRSRPSGSRTPSRAPPDSVGRRPRLCAALASSLPQRECPSLWTSSVPSDNLGEPAHHSTQKGHVPVSEWTCDLPAPPTPRRISVKPTLLSFCPRFGNQEPLDRPAGAGGLSHWYWKVPCLPRGSRVSSKQGRASLRVPLSDRELVGKRRLEMRNRRLWSGKKEWGLQTLRAPI